MKNKEFKKFTDMVNTYYRENGRQLPWRQTRNPYRIWVSEVMLQQTQVSRVVPKYGLFLRTFPTVQRLAEASLREVLSVWSGLGYNRRAKLLHMAAQAIVTERNARMPRTQETWAQVPGIGMNTAGAIMAYAYDEPVVFIETNIRSVYIHEFFHGETQVTDASIIDLVARTLDRDNPREWYWALMDYGSMLKRTTANPSRSSKHYAKQSAFIGSNRQVRGKILRALLEKPLTVQTLTKTIDEPSEKVAVIMQQLLREQLVIKKGRIVSIP